jgi:multiple sugar transport system permease protein
MASVIGRALTRPATAGALLALPATLLMLSLVLVPVVLVIGLSATDWQLGSRTVRFLGFGNYAEMFGDATFRRSLTNTLLYVAFVMPASVGLGLLAALLIEAGIRGRTFFRTVYFLPVASTFVAMATAWQFLLHPRLGLLNALLVSVGLPPQEWLADRSLVLPTLAFVGVWETVGYNMVLFLAGLAAIPRELYAAAEVDGAHRPWDRFATVTWPLLGPTTLFVVAITAIRSFRVFETVAVMTQGGPGDASQVLLYTMYQEGFVFFRAGYGAAITVVFLTFVLLLTLVQLRVLERRVHY